MKSNEIEETQGTIRTHCNSRASRRRAVNRRDCSRRCCAQRSRDRIHSDWPARHRPRKNQATGNWRAKSDSFARDRLNRHAEPDAMQVTRTSGALSTARSRDRQQVRAASQAGYAGATISTDNALT